MSILAVDPGPERSAYCVLLSDSIGPYNWLPNRELLNMLRSGFADSSVTCIESPQAQDRPLGKLLRDTIWWAARFAEVLDNRGTPWCEMDERDVCLWITGNRSGSNAAILQSLKDHFGDKRQLVCEECQGVGTEPGVRGPRKCKACNGRKYTTAPGPLHGMNDHERSALAAALCYRQQGEQRKATA